MSNIVPIVKRVPDFETVVYGTPVAQGRPRFGQGQTYTPRKTREHTELVRWHARQVLEYKGRPTPFLDGPLRLDILFEMPIPASWPKYKKRDAEEGNIRPHGKPDIDNLIKLVKDALNGIVYVDDSRIVRLNAAKHYHDAGGEPRTLIYVWEVGEDG